MADNAKIVAESLVTRWDKDGCATLTLNRPDKRNAINRALFRELREHIVQLSTDESIGLVVLRGAGNNFSAGHDLKEIARHRQDADQGESYLRKLFEDCAEMMQRLTTGPKPTIAVVDGIATAAGAQIVAACDLAFASERATFSLPGVNNGGFCSTPLVAVGRAISRKHAMEMALSGASYDASWAQSVGLINRIIPSNSLMDEVQTFAATLATRHAPAISSGKVTFHAQLEEPLVAAYERAGETMLDHFMDPFRISEEQDSWGKGQ